MKIWLSIILDVIRCIGAYIPISILPDEYWYLKIISFICVLSFIYSINQLRGERDQWKQAVINYQKERFEKIIRFEKLIRKEQNNDRE